MFVEKKNPQNFFQNFSLKIIVGKNKYKKKEKLPSERNLFNLLENKKAKQHKLFQEAEKIYGAYVIEKIKEVFLDSTNYEVELKNKIW